MAEHADPRKFLEWLRAKVESALEGNGYRPWSQAYLKEILVAIRDQVAEELGRGSTPAPSSGPAPPGVQGGKKP